MFIKKISIVPIVFSLKQVTDKKIDRFVDI